MRRGSRLQFFDTAEVYNDGGSEASLGLALKGLPRDRVIIGTKINPSNLQPENVARHCDASLRRLQTDYIDLYMVHWPITPHSIRHFTAENIPTPSVAEALAALECLRAAGKVRFVGVSNFGREKLHEALDMGAEIVANELPYSLLTRAIEFEVLPFCRERAIAVVGYMALMQGLLTDAHPNLDALPPWRRRTRHFDARRSPLSRHGLPGAEIETAAALAGIRQLAERLGTTTARLGLGWAVARGGITCSLCGSRDIRQLAENIQAATEPLDPATLAELNQITHPLMQTLGPSIDYYENTDHDRTK